MAEIEELADIFKLLGDKNRMSIVSFLKEKDLCVCELVELLQTSQPNISQHIRKLKDAGLLKETRKGQWIYYSLNTADKPYLQSVLSHIPSQKEHLVKLSAMNCN
ncbi:ArsR/SmtB family transcription factor [Paenibacillus tarimensis]